MVLGLHRVVGLALLVGVFFAAAGAAFAQSADDPLADEYAEDIPTATGPHHSSGNSGGSASNGGSSYVVPLSPVVRTNLYKQTGRDARLLEKVATSPRYGAPSPRRPEGSGSAASDGGSAASAALSALGGGQSGVPGFLLAVLAATALLAGASLVFRRRETASSPTSP